MITLGICYTCQVICTSGAPGLHSGTAPYGHSVLALQCTVIWHCKFPSKGFPCSKVCCSDCPCDPGLGGGRML